MNNHFEFHATPLSKLDTFSTQFGCNFYIKRDDLFEHGGGGSKARMLQYILFKAKAEGCDYILTAGGPYSNFNRALALLCNKHGLKMRLVLYDKNRHIGKHSLNRKILDICKVEIIECDPQNVERQIETEKRMIVNDGNKPYYVWGGGKSNEGVEAYKDCYNEICETVMPDYIFTAVGTGTTFSGLLAGNSLHQNKSQVIGISVARERALCTEVVSEILREYRSDFTIENCKGELLDDYLLGGYGYTNSDMKKFIDKFIKNQGIIVDPIYVGKALYGAYNYLNERKDYWYNRNIVFLNTGGIYNF